jgi:hypothetical protein
MKWISATINKNYTDDPEEGLETLFHGCTVILNEDGTWYKI